jgi:arylsulfatase A-like enzyme
VAVDWLRRNAAAENWFLHVNFWDVHWPYRFPQNLRGLYAADSLPDWLTEDIRSGHWNGYGPKSARDLGYRVRDHWLAHYPDQPVDMESMGHVRMMFDGYDTSLFHVDRQVGLLMAELDSAGVLDETAVVVTADHGESLGELNMYMSHRLADESVARVPLVVRWPEHFTPGSRDSGLRYHFDFAATVLELLGGTVPANWDARSFAAPVRSAGLTGRPYLVMGAGVGSLSRSIRFENYLCIRAYHDGYNGLPDVSLYDVDADPHEIRDLAEERPQEVGRALRRLDEWYGRMMRSASFPSDPMWNAVYEGGPQDARGTLPGYLKRLRHTGREHWAERLAARYPSEAAGSQLPPQ